MFEEISNMYMREGLRYLNNGKLTSAEQLFKKASYSNKNNWKVKNLQGLCFYTLGDFNRALNLWKYSIQINSEDTNSAYFYINSMKDNDFIFLCESYNESLKYAKAGFFKKAEKLLRHDVFEDCNIVSILNFKGLCLLEIGEINHAVDIWKKVLIIDNENEIAKKYLINSIDRKENRILNILKKIFKK